ncbi:zinc-binding dehydrogenase [Streptosporangium canum]|uniref:zinc-binding dehydrogenase n=1 Tax=Streptosporangium canum TaxID=324952 RepID=UPI003436F7C0
MGRSYYRSRRPPPAVRRPPGIAVAVLPLEQAAAAHERLAEGRTRGKIVLRVMP